MESNNYPEFSKENEEVTANNQVHQEFDYDKYKRTCTWFRNAFIISLVVTIVAIVVGVLELVSLFRGNKTFNAFDWACLVIDILFVLSLIVETVYMFHRWRSYEQTNE